MRIEEPDYIDKTRYSVSLIAAFGFKVQKVIQNGWYDDCFKITADSGKEFWVKRKDFGEWCEKKYRNIRVVQHEN